MDDVLANPVAVLQISFKLEQLRPIFTGRPLAKVLLIFMTDAGRRGRRRAEEENARKGRDGRGGVLHPGGGVAALDPSAAGGAPS